MTTHSKQANIFLMNILIIIIIYIFFKDNTFIYVNKLFINYALNISHQTCMW